MKRQKKGSLRRREIRTGYLMIAPLMAGVIVFFIGAFFQNRSLPGLYLSAGRHFAGRDRSLVEMADEL